jgi:hypothetical protein
MIAPSKIGLGVAAHMPDNTLISRVRKLTPEQLDAELASHEHNDISRHIILQEKTRRAVLDAARPSWIARAAFATALIAAVFAGISALPEIRSWLRGGLGASLSAPAKVTPDYGPPPTDACKLTVQHYFESIFGRNFALEFTEPKQASVDDPDRPEQKIHGWLFEVRGNYRPPSKGNCPIAARILARSDSIILHGSPYGPLERWGTGAVQQDTKTP